MSAMGSINRRAWWNICALGGLGMSQASWLPAMARDAAAHPKRRKSVILLWLNGGPATIDMWDLKPNHQNGGPSREIETSVAGIKISENLPLLARQMNDMALIRSMATREGDHARGRIVGMTGYVPQAAIQFPAVGSLVAHELADPDADLPGFVSIGGGRGVTSLGGGFLGPRFSPLVVSGGGLRRPGGNDDEGEPRVPDLKPSSGISADTQTKRLALLSSMEEGFTPGGESAVVETFRAATDRALKIMQPAAAKAFDLDDEKPEAREAYGRTSFGQGCLMARRLVERGIPFVEVSLDGWDTHQGNFDRVKSLSGNLDRGFAALINDLRERGMLDDTLVVCHGEFGRTPKINGNAGRDHWPATWTAVLAGGGIRCGQVVGKTSEDGTTVESQPTRTPDLIATIVKAVGIDPMKQNMSNVGRPIRIADPTANIIKELL